MGLSYGSHDTGACLIDDGKIVAAVEEERLNREKRTTAFPASSIDYCLGESGLCLSDIDHITAPQHPLLLLKKAFLAQVRMMRGMSLPAFLHDIDLAWEMLNLHGKITRSGEEDLKDTPPICFVPHHSAHAASAFLASPFSKAAVITIDGVGELETITMSVGQDRELRKLRAYEFPYSVGKFYGAVCRYLGFSGPSKEGKVMGLSAHGDPSHYASRLLDLVSFDSEDGRLAIDLSFFSFGWYPGSPSVVSEKFISEFGPPRHREGSLSQEHMDVAAGLQVALEHVVMAMLRHLNRLTGESRLCMAGGVALNSVLNGKVRENTPFSDVFIQPAANDGGLALGGALYFYNCVLNRPRIQPMTHVFFGPSYSDEEIARALYNAGLRFHRSKDIAREAASELARGRIVGWFQGRVELGPRALGSRSILADPRRAETRDRVNAKVKHRESFRPFAPVVLEEEASKYFITDHTSPFMLEVCDVRPEMIDVIPAVTHVDGTARIQTINESQNPLYYRLVKEFAELTGIAVLLNTSFNDRGEPIVCTPNDAVATFKRTGLDTLAIGPYISAKPRDP
jgi:carbamoyltransferase